MKKLKIIDLSTLIPGPFTSFLLGKYLDCQIVKFEDVRQRDPLSNLRPTKNGIGFGYQAINNKKKIEIVDYGSEGIERIKKEVKDADILIENFKEGRADKLGIGWDEIKKINPKIIYCSIRGYPSGNPLAGKAAHDGNILALSGYLSQQFQSTSQLVLPPVQLADIFTAYHATVRILSKLLEGKSGAHLIISMLEACYEAMTIYNTPQMVTKRDIQPAEILTSGNYPCYSIYESSDGKRIVVAALESTLWIDFCHHIKREDLIARQFDTFAKDEVAKQMKKYKADVWLNKTLDFCVTPVLSINEAVKYKYVPR